MFFTIVAVIGTILLIASGVWGVVMLWGQPEQKVSRFYYALAIVVYLGLVCYVPPYAFAALRDLKAVPVPDAIRGLILGVLMMALMRKKSL